MWNFMTSDVFLKIWDNSFKVFRCLWNAIFSIIVNDFTNKSFFNYITHHKISFHIKAIVFATTLMKKKNSWNHSERKQRNLFLLQRSQLFWTGNKGEITSVIQIALISFLFAILLIHPHYVDSRRDEIGLKGCVWNCTVMDKVRKELKGYRKIVSFNPIAKLFCRNDSHCWVYFRDNILEGIPSKRNSFVYLFKQSSIFELNHGNKNCTKKPMILKFNIHV